MRDLVAVVVVIVLVVAALRMATSLQWHKRDHEKIRSALRDRGHTVVAEIPGESGLGFFSEDASAFYWGDTTIPKPEIRATRVLISGAPLSVRVSNRFPEPAPTAAPESTADTSFEAFERNRWDVAIDVEYDTVLVECGAIRDRVSQDLARHVFDTVSADIAAREQTAVPSH